MPSYIQITVTSPHETSGEIYMWHLYISCLDISNSKFMLQVKSLQGKLLILVSVILNCSKENALNVMVWDLDMDSAFGMDEDVNFAAVWFC